MRKKQFDINQVKAARGGGKNFRIDQTLLQDMPLNELAFWALSAQSERHRIAAMAMLLRKLNQGPIVREVINSLEIRKSDNGPKAAKKNG